MILEKHIPDKAEGRNLDNLIKKNTDPNFNANFNELNYTRANSDQRIMQQ